MWKVLERWVSLVLWGSSARSRLSAGSGRLKRELEAEPVPLLLAGRGLRVEQQDFVALDGSLGRGGEE